MDVSFALGLIVNAKERTCLVDRHYISGILITRNICYPQVFQAHRCVLSAASPYFGAMFGGGLAEQGKAEIQIHNVSPDIFGVILDFMYCGKSLLCM